MLFEVGVEVSSYTMCDAGKGVTIPSQRRFVHYYQKWLLRKTEGATMSQLISPAHHQRVHLKRVRIVTAPHFDADGGCDPYAVSIACVLCLVVVDTIEMCWQVLCSLPLAWW